MTDQINVYFDDGSGSTSRLTRARLSFPRKGFPQIGSLHPLGTTIDSVSIVMEIDRCIDTHPPPLY